MTHIIAKFIKRFFSYYLPVQKGLAVNTILAYRDDHIRAAYQLLKQPTFHIPFQPREVRLWTYHVVRSDNMRHGMPEIGDDRLNPRRQTVRMYQSETLLTQQSAQKWA